MTLPAPTHTAAPRAPARAHAQVLSLGEYRPRRAVSNEELIQERRLSTTDDWVRQRTGIASRRLAEEHESLPYMGARAAEEALRRGGFAPEDVDCVLAASMSNLAGGSPLARRIAEELGARPRTALDVSAACAGFCVCLEVARGMVTAHGYRRVLIVGAERMTDIVDPYDRTTSVIFADGAGAALVTPADEPAIGAVSWRTDGERRDLLSRSGTPPEPDRAALAGATTTMAAATPASASAVTTSAASASVSVEHVEHVEPAEGARDGYLRMRGPELYRWVMAHVPGAARTAVHRAGVSMEDLRAFVPHQANDRITTALCTALGIQEDTVVARDVVSTGNTSAASVPMATARLLRERPDLAGELALLVGFGAGVTVAAQVVRLP
ncbi:beta-ketoacyl-ACP synthase 3 [Streptomyces daliensis]|uniref:Beta-ketoacyl-ACP synthase 3 n=1 Tax=Streptomyces daliensis TaxID=299421 RepID=A0A8T4ITN8_9ACTN|nr:beta-ketoacyl-ACP synthase 3 [Streptomyces daliensis]